MLASPVNTLFFFQTLAVPSARCTYPHINVWYLQQPWFERKRGYRETDRPTDLPTDRQTNRPTYRPTYRPTDPTDYNNPSLRMRTLGLTNYCQHYEGSLTLAIIIASDSIIMMLHTHIIMSLVHDIVISEHACRTVIYNTNTATVNMCRKVWGIPKGTLWYHNYYFAFTIHAHVYEV